MPSDTVWRELSQNLKGVMSSKALYTLVKRNGHNIWQHLGLESVLIKQEQEPDQKALHETQETSSSSVHSSEEPEDIEKLNVHLSPNKW